MREGRKGVWRVSRREGVREGITKAEREGWGRREGGREGRREVGREGARDGDSVERMK